jgi:hypothetical protein
MSSLAYDPQVLAVGSTTKPLRCLHEKRFERPQTQPVFLISYKKDFVLGKHASSISVSVRHFKRD